MMTIDETLEFADKIYELAYDFENNFFDWDTYPMGHRVDFHDSPVYKDCLRYIFHAAFELSRYVRGFKEMQFAQ